MTEPAYSFTLASVEDDTTLNCRIYQPNGSTSSAPHRPKGAVLAHPYAPLGGSYDDPVVLAIAETLLSQDYVVATFNFRGAGGSAGKTTWTGRAETEDYVSVAGFLVYYLHFLTTGSSTGGEGGLPSRADSSAADADNGTLHSSRGPIELLLAGYSYGSLVLAKLPSPSSIIQRFQSAAQGTTAAEIVLRARALAKQTQRLSQELHAPVATTRPRGRSLKPGDAAINPVVHQRPKASPVTVGGEETAPSQRRSSRDSRRSVDVIRKSVEVPRKIKAHLRRQSGRSSAEEAVGGENGPHAVLERSDAAVPSVSVRYLLVSPVLLPFTNMLCPPGPPSFAVRRRTDADAGAGAQFLRSPTLAVFGSSDSFTASRRLRAWAERQAKDSTASTFTWKEFEGAGHFWREAGTMRALQERIATWLEDFSSS